MIREAFCGALALFLFIAVTVVQDDSGRMPYDRTAGDQ